MRQKTNTENSSGGYISIFRWLLGLPYLISVEKAIANLEYESIKHLNPVFLNDTIYVRTKILDKRESKSKSDRGIIYVESIAYNQNGVDVLSFRRKVLVKKKEL